MAFMEMKLLPDYGGFLIAALPPGGFLVLGFLLAGKRILDGRLVAWRSAGHPVSMEHTAAT